MYTTLDYRFDYIFYYSNWGNMFTTLTFWLLYMSHSHRHSRNEKYQSFVCNFFEIVVAMEYLINILYWTLLFDRSTIFDFWSPDTYRGPILNHLLPFVLLNIELMLSGLIFDHSKNYRYFLYLLVVYCSFNYFGFLYQGAPVYYFLNYNDSKTVIIIFSILILQTTLYLIVATLNNKVIKRFLLE